MYTYDKCPFHTKRELVEWARDYYKLPKNRFQKLTKKQLYYFFYNPKKYSVGA